MVLLALSCCCCRWLLSKQVSQPASNGVVVYLVELELELAVCRRTLGTSRERGRKRVPRDAPPTCRQRDCQYFNCFVCGLLLKEGEEVGLGLTRITALVAPWWSPLGRGRWGIWRDDMTGRS